MHTLDGIPILPNVNYFLAISRQQVQTCLAFSGFEGGENAESLLANERDSV
jgi:hypothetical protein